MTKAIHKIRNKGKKYFFKGFMTGLGWSVGITLGFAFVSSIAVYLLSGLKTAPVIGDFVANIIVETDTSLANKK